MLNLTDGKNLINIAKQSINSYFSKDNNPSEKIKDNIKNNIKEKYNSKQGVFVTLKKNNQLRGCIGYIEGIYPLWEGIWNTARSAAFEDPRFSPLSKSELAEINYEVTILTIPEEIKVKKIEEYIKQIKIGRDGLIVKRGPLSGLLLPQVFPEWNADELKALEMTCEKAGLPSDAWKDNSVHIYKFSGQVFSEKNGDIIEENYC